MSYEHDPEEPLTPAEFRLEVVAQHNKDLFDQYITLRLKGRPAVHCLRMVFGDEYANDSQGYARVFGLESSKYFMTNFARRLSEIKFSELWNPKEAVLLLLTIANDPAAKDQARLNAIAELNVLSGITMVDGSGNSKVTRGLADFYKDTTSGTESTPLAKTQADSQLKH